MSFLQAGVYVSLVICLAGLLWRVRGRLSGDFSRRGAGQKIRAKSALAGFIRDVVLLGRTAKKSPYRWLAHGLILAGFLYLLLFHALGWLFASWLTGHYQPTLEPWQSLRNLAGCMVAAGLAMATLRRLKNRRLRALSRARDWLFLALLAGIIGSGFLLEAGKMISPPVFDRMSSKYLGTGDAGDLKALKAHWAQEYGVAFEKGLPGDSVTLAKGAGLSAQSCVHCHSRMETAFVSHGLAGVIKPIAGLLNRLRADLVFYYLHVLLCLLGLALLPWGKFIHPLATPVSLLLCAQKNPRLPENGASPPRFAGLTADACTGCGECSLHCSVAPAFAVLKNTDILPSEKLASLRGHGSGRLAGEELQSLIRGNQVCTECRRCTDLCPAGIDLQSIWLGLKKEFHRTGPPSRGLEPARRVRELKAGRAKAPAFGRGLSLKRETFQPCLQCSTCTGVCPVAALSPDLSGGLDCAPQQVMNLLRMGLLEQAMASNMIWSCATCYKCQEHCPENIPVADVMFELRNMAAQATARAAKGGPA